MKSNKEIVYEFIKKYSSGYQDDIPMITTQYLSEKLNMQRSNISALLNQLVKEGLLEKRQGRPVYYRLKKLKSRHRNFEGLIGYQDSLREAVMLAKAAVLYPDQKCSILLVGPRGSGLNYFAHEVYEFAVESKKLKKNAPFILFDCKTFVERTHQIKEVLFHKQEGMLKKANEGILFIKNVDLLTGYDRTLLFEVMNGNYQTVKQIMDLPEDFKTNIICTLSSSISVETLEVFKSKVNFYIELPPLSQRSFEERWQFIQLFLKTEAKKLNRMIEVDATILHCLFLYQTNKNIKGLKKDIQSACANAYVRECQNHNPSLHLLLTDFPNYVRKGLIYYKEYKNDICQYVPDNCRLAFKENEILSNTIESQTKSLSTTIHQKRKHLIKEKLNQDDIEHILLTDIFDDFQHYYQQLVDKVPSQELDLFVSHKLIQCVQTFIIGYQKEFHCQFEHHLLVALCVHFNSLMVNVSNTQHLTHVQIDYFIEKYDKEYQYVCRFVDIIEKEFHMTIKQDEKIFILLFMIPKKQKEQVVTLLAMHGKGATSIVDVVKQMIHTDNIYAFDLSLDENIEEAYEKLKQKIIHIHQGKGILLIYDMGSLHTMVESIACETNISIQYIQVPITMIALSSSQQAKLNHSLEDIYQHLQSDYQGYRYVRPQKENMILIISKKSIENALQVREDIYSSYDYEGYHIECIYVSSSLDLFNQIDSLSKQYKIYGIISDETLQLKQYSYITYDEVYKHEVSSIELLFYKPQQEQEELLEVLGYLEGQLEKVDIREMSMMLINFVNELEKIMEVSLITDQKIGLLVHIACLVDGLLKGKTQSVHFNVINIIQMYGDKIEEIKKALQLIEQTYGVTMSDSDIATMISIIFHKERGKEL